MPPFDDCDDDSTSTCLLSTPYEVRSRDGAQQRPLSPARDPPPPGKKRRPGAQKKKKVKKPAPPAKKAVQATAPVVRMRLSGDCARELDDSVVWPTSPPSPSTLDEIDELFSAITVRLLSQSPDRRPSRPELVQQARHHPEFERLSKLCANVELNYYVRLHGPDFIRNCELSRARCE